MKKLLLLPILLFFICQSLLAQKNLWVNSIRTIGDNSTGTVSSFYIDANGDFVLSGSFQGTIDLDFSSGEKLHTRVSSGEGEYGTSIFFAKYDKDLNLKWSYDITNDHSIYIMQIAKGKSDSINIIGAFDSTTDFDPSSSTTSISSSKWVNTASDVFISKFDKDGKFGSVALLINANSSAYWGDLNTYVDTVSNSVSMIGTYSGYNNAPLDFNPYGTTNLSGPNETNYFVASYSLAPLKLNWVNLIPRTATVAGNTTVLGGVTTDNTGNIYMSGRVRGTYDFDPTAGVSTVESDGGTGHPGFIAKYYKTGTLAWVKKMSSTYNLSINQIRVDNGNIYAIGSSSGGTGDLDPNSGNFPVVSPDGNEIGFLTKYSCTDGSLVWAELFQKPSTYTNYASVHANDIILNGTDNHLRIVGRLYGAIDFDASSNKKILTSLGETDLFIATYDLDGNYISAINAGNTYYDETFNIALDKKGAIYVTGQVWDMVNFNPYPPYNTYGTTEKTVYFLAKYAPFGAIGYDQINSCKNASANLLALGMGDTSATYQWYKEDVLQIGKTSPILTINGLSTADEGDYSCIIISSRFGKDTLKTNLVVRDVCPTAVIPGSSTIYSYKVNPNPTNGMIRFSTGENIKINSVSIHNYLGEEVLSLQTENQEEVFINTESLIPGIYYARINNSMQSLKIVRE